MALPKGGFRFSFKRDATTWLFWDGTTVDTSLTPVYATDAPDGWDKTQLDWVRSKFYKGLFTSVATPFRWSGKNAKLINYLFTTEGSEATCYVVIEKFNYAPGQNVWEDFYTGKVQFGKYSMGFSFVTAPLAPVDLAQKLYDNEDVPHLIYIDDIPRIQPILEGLDLKATYHLLFTEITADGYTGLPVPDSLVKQYNALINKDGSYDVGTVNTLTFIDVDSTTAAPNIANRDAYQYEATIDHFIRIKHHQQFRAEQKVIGASIDLNLQLWYVIADRDTGLKRVSVKYFDADRTLVDDDFAVWDVAYEGIIEEQIFAWERVYIGFVLTPSGATGRSPNFPWYIGTGFPDLFKWFDGVVDIEARFRLDTTIAKMATYYDVYDALINKITGQNLVSPLLTSGDSYVDNIPNQTYLVSGTMLRGFENAAYSIRLRDIHKDSSNFWMLALGIVDGDIVVDLLLNFLDSSTEIFNLGEITDVEDDFMTPAPDFIFNQVDVGQPTQDYDNINGLDEFNVTQTYKFPLSSRQEKMDLVCPFRRDMYGMEEMRANLLGQTTTDNESDNDTFAVSIEEDGLGWKLRRPQNTPPNFATGLLFPEGAYNIDHSPKRTLFRNAPLLASINYLREAETITYQFNKKNTNLVSDLGFGVITETADVEVTELGDGLFQPVLFKFTAKSPVNLVNLMLATPFGFFSFTYKGVELKGFPMKIGIIGAHPDTYKFELLCCRDVDLTQII